MLCSQVSQHAYIYTHTRTHMLMHVCILYIHISIQIVRAHIQKFYHNIWRRVKSGKQLAFS